MGGERLCLNTRLGRSGLAWLSCLSRFQLRHSLSSLLSARERGVLNRTHSAPGHPPMSSRQIIDCQEASPGPLSTQPEPPLLERGLEFHMEINPQSKRLYLAMMGNTPFPTSLPDPSSSQSRWWASRRKLPLESSARGRITPSRRSRCLLLPL